MRTSGTRSLWTLGLLWLAASYTLAQREQRSIFNILRFSEDPCTDIEGNTGLCISRKECTNAGGMSVTQCALGLGACCIFVADTCGDSVTRNGTYIRNPGFPANYDDTTGCSYTIQKGGNSVCQLRLSFEAFTILGPAVTDESDGGACSNDMLAVNVPSGQVIPVICGANTGQHIYLDVGSDDDTATLNFDFDTVSNVRTWSIRVEQIPCTSITRAPDGCLQYFLGNTGRLTNFNNLSPGGSPSFGLHLANQNYAICIRSEEGNCRIKYNVCENQNTEGFTLSTFVAAGVKKALFETQCIEDFITIEGATFNCLENNLYNRFCGNLLGFTPPPATTVNNEVCDTSDPFIVRFRTDATADKGAMNNFESRGFCLDYRQEPCGLE